MPSANRGKLIVFEGLDRSGKSTQCTRLVSHLRHQGHTIAHLRFPDRITPIGQMINTYLTNSSSSAQEDHVIHLLFSANRWEAAQTITNHLAAGTTVVIDRYYYSGCVYSAAKRRSAMDLAWCRQPEVGLPRPDVCLFLDVSAEDAATRGGFGEERYENREMQDRVRELFREMREHGDEREDIVVVDAGIGMDEVEQAIREVVEGVIRRVDEKGEGARNVRSW